MRGKKEKEGKEQKKVGKGKKQKKTWESEEKKEKKRVRGKTQLQKGSYLILVMVAMMIK